MDIPVIISHGGLFAMEKSGDSGKYPDPDTPFRCQPKADGGIDSNKPAVAGCSVQNTASQWGFLPVMRQLSVGAVV